MREITTHQVLGDTAPQVKVYAHDENDHQFLLVVDNAESPTGSTGWTIQFQNGPLKEVGPNGITIESLLAVCQDRLKQFQAGPYNSWANKMAIHFIQLAMAELHQRTQDRIARGVEGRNQQ
jgi:hypothetical protein